MQSTPAVYQRVYVKVNSEFDSTGYMHPKTIEWEDGRIFQIDEVISSTASGYSIHKRGSCYTVKIRNKTIYLFFEMVDSMFPSRLGRWYIERRKSQEQVGAKV